MAGNVTLLGSTPLEPCRDVEEYRKLGGIIVSCLTTIFLCTWISVHPNVPDQSLTRRWRLEINAVYLFVVYSMED